MPFDLLNDWPGWTTEFEPQHRQEMSRTAGGVTRVKDFGTALWRLSAVTKTLSPNALDIWRARVEEMENGKQTFYGYPLSRTYPMQHPNGAGLPGSVTVSAIGTDGDTLSLSGASGLKLSIGDMVSVGGVYLYRVMQASTGGSAFKVRPPVAPAVAGGQSVKIVRPSCVMMVLPGSVQSQADPSTGRGSVSFQAIETRS